jgi:hypothetical protein
MLEVNLAFWGFSEVRFESFESNSRTLVYQLARSFGKKVKKDVRPLRIYREFIGCWYTWGLHAHLRCAAIKANPLRSGGAKPMGLLELASL